MGNSLISLQEHVINVIIDEKGTIVDFNNLFKEVYENKRESNVSGLNVSDIVYDWNNVWKKIKQFKEGKYQLSALSDGEFEKSYDKMILWYRVEVSKIEKIKYYNLVGIELKSERMKDQESRIKFYSSILVNFEEMREKIYHLNNRLEKLEELERSEEHYMNAVEASNEGLWDWNIITGKLYVTKRLFEVLESKNCDEIKKRDDCKTWFELKDEDLKKKIQNMVMNYFYENDEFYNYEYQVKKKEDEENKESKEKWIHSRGKIIRNEEGIPVKISGVFSDITKRKRNEMRMQYYAYYDLLTYLPNRILFLSKLKESIKIAVNSRHQGSVIYIDLDNFKVINDTLGHDYGDEFLKKVSAKLRASVGRYGILARFGGDEFALNIEKIESIQQLSEIAEEILAIISRMWNVKDKEFMMSASIGIAIYPDDGSYHETLLKNADTAMYRAKEDGKNRYRFYAKEMNEKMIERVEIESELMRAIEKNEFLVYYQPKVNIETGLVMSYEALVRWQNPKKGIISPGKFIPIAEQTDTILKIGEIVLKEACRQNKEWIDKGYYPTVISVNMSAKQFNQDGIVQRIENILKKVGMPSKYLEVEITESAIMESLDNAIEILNELKRIGVKIALDDFGTGYSSLNYLKKLPIDTLKIDKSFVEGIGLDKKNENLLGATIELARRMELELVIEGVETELQLNFLREQKCKIVQGYYYSKPLKAKEIEGKINSGGILSFEQEMNA